jgi:hypothetical protein
MTTHVLASGMQLRKLGPRSYELLDITGQHVMYLVPEEVTYAESIASQRAHTAASGAIRVSGAAKASGSTADRAA